MGGNRNKPKLTGSVGSFGGDDLTLNSGKLIMLPINDENSSRNAECDDSPSFSKAMLTRPNCTKTTKTDRRNKNISK